MTPQLWTIEPWASLSGWQLVCIALSFLWSGFVRSGLGFGGAALTLPFLLLIVNEPIVWLPAVCLQLLFFSLLTVATRLDFVNGRYLLSLSARLAVPFALGLFGLLNLPGLFLSIVVYCATLFYGVNYMFDRRMVSHSRWSDALFLGVGGYVSGVSLTGAPLIVAVGSRELPAHQLRDTLFVMWIVLVLFKLGTFAVAGVSFQWALALVTFPIVALGHWLGLKLHARLVQGDTGRFNRVIGTGLSAVSVVGLVSLLRTCSGL